MSFWNGTFAKHRDYQHGSFFEHIMDHSASYGVAENVRLNAEIDPASLSAVDGGLVVSVVRIRFQNNDTYDYFIPSGSTPDRETIKENVDKQASTPKNGEERTAFDILDLDSLAEYESLTDDDFTWHRQ